MALIHGDAYIPKRQAIPSEWTVLQDVVDEAVKQQQAREPLDRLQRTLIWFAAILIAVSMYENITNLLL